MKVQETICSKKTSNGGRTIKPNNTIIELHKTTYINKIEERNTKSIGL